MKRAPLVGKEGERNGGKFSTIQNDPVFYLFLQGNPGDFCLNSPSESATLQDKVAYP